MFLGPHLYRSVIILSVRVQFNSGGHQYWSTITLSYQFVFRDRTYIDRSLSCQLEFGSAPISIGHHPISLSLSRGRTYIDRPFPCHISLWVGTAPISIGHSFCQFQFSSSWDRTYIDRSFIHLPFSLSRGRTHIDRPFSYQFVFSLSRDRTHIDRSFILPVRSVRRPGLCFSMTFRVTFPFWAFRVTFLTWLLWCLLLDRHCSFRIPLPLHMTQSFEITTRIFVMS